MGMMRSPRRQMGKIPNNINFKAGGLSGASPKGSTIKLPIQFSSQDRSRAALNGRQYADQIRPAEERALEVREQDDLE